MPDAKELKVLIFYFSGTGSTAYAAWLLGKNFEQYGIKVDFLELKRVLPEVFNVDLSDYALLGIGTPTHSFRAPRLSTSILKRLPLFSKPYFLFLTCGGMPGNTFWSLYKVMKKKDNVLLETFSFYGPNNLRSWRPQAEGSSVRELQSQYLPSDGLDADYEIIIADKVKRLIDLLKKSKNNLGFLRHYQVKLKPHLG